LKELAFEFKFKSEARPIENKEKPEIHIIFDLPNAQPILPADGMSLVYRVREQPASPHRALALFGGLIYALQIILGGMANYCAKERLQAHLNSELYHYEQDQAFVSQRGTGGNKIGAEGDAITSLNTPSGLSFDCGILIRDLSKCCNSSTSKWDHLAKEDLSHEFDIIKMVRRVRMHGLALHFMTNQKEKLSASEAS
jgi:hypothetical protein